MAGLLKPDQGGSGARIQVVESLAEVEAIFARDPDIWLPDEPNPAGIDARFSRQSQPR